MARDGEGGLTLRVLVRPVDIVAADNDGGELEALLIRVHQHLGGGLAGGIGVGRGQDARLEQIVVIVTHLAVDLIGRDVDEAADVYLFGTLQQHVGAVDIGMGKVVRVAKAQVDVRLGGKVEDCIDAVALQAVDHLGRVGDVALVKGKVALVVEHTRVVERGAVVQLVKRHDVVRVWIGQGQVAHQPACAAIGLAGEDVRVSDEVLHKASTARDHNVLHVGERRELCGANEHRSLLPDAIVLEEGLAPVVAWDVLIPARLWELRGFFLPLAAAMVMLTWCCAGLVDCGVGSGGPARTRRCDEPGDVTSVQ